MQKLEATYQWTEAQCILAYDHHAHTHCGKLFRVMLQAIAIMALLVAWLFYRLEGISAPVIILPIVGIYVLFFHRMDRHIMVRHHFRKRPDRDVEICWTLDESSLDIQTPGTDYRAQWAQISKAFKAKEGFLIYPHDTLFFWLPFSAFENEEQRNMAETILREKVKTFKMVT